MNVIRTLTQRRNWKSIQNPNIIVLQLKIQVIACPIHLCLHPHKRQNMIRGDGPTKELALITLSEETFLDKNIDSEHSKEKDRDKDSDKVESDEDVDWTQIECAVKNTFETLTKKEGLVRFFTQ